MGLKIWVRCLAVSAVIAAVAPLFSMSVSAPQSDSQDYELTEEEREWLAEADIVSVEESAATASTASSSNIQVAKSFISHPQFVIFYLKATFTWFVGLLVATLLVSYLNLRNYRLPKS